MLDRDQMYKVLRVLRASCPSDRTGLPANQSSCPLIWRVRVAIDTAQSETLLEGAGYVKARWHLWPTRAAKKLESASTLSQLARLGHQCQIMGIEPEPIWHEGHRQLSLIRCLLCRQWKYDPRSPGPTLATALLPVLFLLGSANTAAG